MWTLTIEDEQGVMTRVELARDVYSVGRDPASDICLLERNISRRHATLRARPEGEWELLDHESRTGCFVNGRRLRVRALLSPSDAVHVGDYLLRVLDGEAAYAGGERPQAARAPSKPDRLVVLEGPEAGRELRLDRGPLTVGGGQGVHLRLSDQALRFTVRAVGGRRYEVINVGPRAELSVNFAPAWRKLLEDGDHIEVPGEVALRFVRGGRPSGDRPGAPRARPDAGEPGFTGRRIWAPPARPSGFEQPTPPLPSSRPRPAFAPLPPVSAPPRSPAGPSSRPAPGPLPAVSAPPARPTPTTLPPISAPPSRPGSQPSPPIDQRLSQPEFWGPPAVDQRISRPDHRSPPAVDQRISHPDFHSLTPAAQRLPQPDFGSPTPVDQRLSQPDFRSSTPVDQRTSQPDFRTVTPADQRLVHPEFWAITPAAGLPLPSAYASRPPAAGRPPSSAPVPPAVAAGRSSWPGPLAATPASGFPAYGAPSSGPAAGGRSSPSGPAPAPSSYRPAPASAPPPGGRPFDPAPRSSPSGRPFAPAPRSSPPSGPASGPLPAPPSYRPAAPAPPSAPPASGRPSRPAFSSTPASGRPSRPALSSTPASGRPSGKRHNAVNTLDGQVKALGEGVDSASMPISLSRLPASQGALIDEPFRYPSAAARPRVSLLGAPASPRRGGGRARKALPGACLIALLLGGASYVRRFQAERVPGAKPTPAAEGAGRSSPGFPLAGSATPPGHSASGAASATAAPAGAAPPRSQRGPG